MSYKTITYIDREDTQWLMNGWGGSLPVSEEDQELLTRKGGSELLNMRAVANAVVKRIHELDINEQERRLSNARPRGFQVGDAYPMHGVIVVNDIAMAHDLETYLNEKFAKDTNRFPRSRGWRAVSTDSKSRQPFDKTHPFFHFRETSRISQNSARILIVVDRATEGMNNKYLGVMGIAKRTRSILEVVQRLGRLVRSAHYEKDGVKYAPPVAHDMVHVITHVEYENPETIQSSLDFMKNMEPALSDMLSIEEYAEFGVEVADTDDSYRPNLNYEEMMIISDIVGASILSGKRLSVRKIHNRIYTKKAAKREYITKVARDMHARSEGACRRVAKDLFSETLPVPVQDLAIDDRMRLDPLSEEELNSWLESRQLTAMLQLVERGTPQWVEAGQQIYRAVEGQYYSGHMESAQTVMATIDEVVSEVIRILRFNNGKRAVVANLVENAALDLLSNLGATMQRLADDGDLNIPAVVAELRNPQWKSQVTRWVFWQLYQQGHLKNLTPFIDSLTN